MLTERRPRIDERRGADAETQPLPLREGIRIVAGPRRRRRAARPRARRDAADNGFLAPRSAAVPPRCLRWQPNGGADLVLLDLMLPDGDLSLLAYSGGWRRPCRSSS